MIFDGDWVEKTNASKSTKEERLAVSYKNGFKGTKDFNENYLAGWTVVSAEDNKM